MLKKITFEIETLTPMFIAGAEQSKVELRAASIKGLLRWWWRAIQAEPNIEELRKKESAIFGSSDEGVGGSKFSIRVTTPDKNPVCSYPNPGRQDSVGYLFYSTFMQRGKERPYFPEGSRFKIILTSKDETCLKIAVASLWALIYLGGLGTRSRRGAGNIVVTNTEDKENILATEKLDFIPKGINEVEVAGWLKHNFEAINKIIITGKTKFASEYSNLSFSRFIISTQHFTTWKDALGATGFKMFRDKNKARIFETAAFGVPILHRNSKTTVKGKVESTTINRRSSPVIFKVIRAQNNYYWFVLRLSGEFLPQSGMITANQSTQKPDFGIIDEFWAELKGKGNEHILTIPDTLKHLIEGIKKEDDPQRIILFGSKARGDFHSRSDTDIAVEAEKQLNGSTLNGALDMVNLKTADESLKKKINKEGVIIYERKS
jgi:CRISPR-associated protein Cmr1